MANLVHSFIKLHHTENFKVNTGAKLTAVPAMLANIPSQIQLAQGQLAGPGNNVLTVPDTFPATPLWRGLSTVQCVYVLPD